MRCDNSAALLVRREKLDQCGLADRFTRRAYAVSARRMVHRDAQAQETFSAAKVQGYKAADDILKARVRIRRRPRRARRLRRP